MKKGKRAWLRSLAGLSINISAGWLGLVFIGPNFSLPSSIYEFFTLIISLVFGIIFLLITVLLERRLL